MQLVVLGVCAMVQTLNDCKLLIKKLSDFVVLLTHSSLQTYLPAISLREFKGLRLHMGGIQRVKAPYRGNSKG